MDVLLIVNSAKADIQIITQTRPRLGHEILLGVWVCLGWVRLGLEFHNYFARWRHIPRTVMHTSLRF